MTLASFSYSGYILRQKEHHCLNFLNISNFLSTTPFNMCALRRAILIGRTRLDVAWRACAWAFSVLSWACFILLSLVVFVLMVHSLFLHSSLFLCTGVLRLFCAWQHVPSLLHLIILFCLLHPCYVYVVLVVQWALFCSDLGRQRQYGKTEEQNKYLYKMGSGVGGTFQAKQNRHSCSLYLVRSLTPVFSVAGGASIFRHLHFYPYFSSCCHFLFSY